MAQFSVPAESKKYSVVVESFRGVDLNNSPSNVDKSRSPEAPNMIRDQVGKVRKRTGYTTKATVSGGAAINGVHRLGDEVLVHAGTKLYRRTVGTGGAWSLTEIGTMANARSRGVVFDEKLYLLDGSTFRVYDGTTLKAVSENATVPTIIISRRPTGGGTAYQGLNLIGTKWTESFLGTANDTVYQLTTDGLDSTPVTAEVLSADGTWVAKAETTDFTVDRQTGKVTFKTAPGESPVTGQDNVHITASKTREGYADTINKCRLATVYGVGGATDRIFVSGNPEKKGTDFYSAFENPTFFPDVNYTKIARDGGEIVGYTVLSNTLAAFLSGGANERNVVVRTGSLDEDGEAVFRITNTIIGQDAVAPDSFCRTDKEPLFLTDRGVYAITAEELTGEKYSQERSYYIGGAIREATGREEASACIYGDFYVLALGGTLYLLDLQLQQNLLNAQLAAQQQGQPYSDSLGGEMSWEQYLDKMGATDYQTKLQEAISAQVQQAVDDYNRQIEETGTNYEEAARRAYINNMLSRRNMDQELAASGVYGGMADSQRIAMEADYQNNLTDLETQYADTISQLQQAVTNARLSGDAQVAEQMAAYLSQVQGQYSNYLSQLQQERAAAALAAQQAQAQASLLAQENSYSTPSYYSSSGGSSDGSSYSGGSGSDSYTGAGRGIDDYVSLKNNLLMLAKKGDVELMTSMLQNRWGQMNAAQRKDLKTVIYNNTGYEINDNQ